ncbi:hypothetical protein V2O64_24360 (plasmid) [Verrucomicrobiaceae bacterium 227]
MSKKFFVSFTLAAIVLPACDPDSQDKTYKSSTRGPTGENDGRGQPLTPSAVSDRVSSFRLALEADDISEIKKNVSEMDMAEILILINEMRREEGNISHLESYLALVKELARRDPEAALKLFNVSEIRRGEKGWPEVANEIAATDPERLQDWLLNELPRADRSAHLGFLSSGVVALLHQVSPEKALEFSLKTDRTILSEAIIAQLVFGHYGKMDPRGAEAAALQFFSGIGRDLALFYTAQGSIGTDDSHVRGIIEKIAEGNLRDQLMFDQFRHAAGENLQTTLGQLKELTPVKLAAILRQDDPLRLGGNGELSMKIATSSPTELVSLMKQITVSGGNHEVFARAISALVTAENGAYALELISSMPEGGLRDGLYGDYIRAILKTDPDSALTQIEKIPDGAGRSQAYRQIAETMSGRTGLQDTMKTAMLKIPESYRGEYLGAAMPSFVERSPEEVREFLGTNQAGSLSPEDRKTTIENLGFKITSQNVDSGAEWLGDLPDQDQPAAMKGIASQLVKSDPERLVNLLSELPKDQTWESGVRVVVSDLKNSDPATAKEWESALRDAGFE